MKKITQAKWDCTTDGKLTGLFPDNVKAEFDLTKIFLGWAGMTEAEQFFTAYGFKQKCMDLSSDPKWTYQEKADRAQELYDYVVEHGSMPKTERKGGFGISKAKVSEVVSGVEAIMAKFKVPKEVAEGIQAELDKLNVGK